MHSPKEETQIDSSAFFFGVIPPIHDAIRNVCFFYAFMDNKNVYLHSKNKNKKKVPINNFMLNSICYLLLLPRFVAQMQQSFFLFNAFNVF